MKKIAEKIAIVALVCIAFVFVLLTILYATNVIPSREPADNAVAIVLLSVLALAYVGISAYLLIINFSEVFNLKRILLFYDSESTTRASHKVIKNIVKGCAKEFPQIKIKRCVCRVDDKMGLVANISLESLVAEDIAAYVPKLKCLIAKSLRESLGIKFNAINFDVVRLSKKYTPTDTNVETAMQIPSQEDTTNDYHRDVTEQPVSEEDISYDTYYRGYHTEPDQEEMEEEEEEELIDA